MSKKILKIELKERIFISCCACLILFGVFIDCSQLFDIDKSKMIETDIFEISEDDQALIDSLDVSTTGSCYTIPRPVSDRKGVAILIYNEYYGLPRSVFNNFKKLAKTLLLRRFEVHIFLNCSKDEIYNKCLSTSMRIEKTDDMFICNSGYIISFENESYLLTRGVDISPYSDYLAFEERAHIKSLLVNIEELIRYISFRFDYKKSYFVFDGTYKLPPKMASKEIKEGFAEIRSMSIPSDAIVVLDSKPGATVLDNDSENRIFLETLTDFLQNKENRVPSHIEWVAGL